MVELPVLYSFRRCPYAIRARMALQASRTQVALREVVLKNKPQEFLETSPKGTVPVLVLENGIVLEESLDIMHWALRGNDPNALLPSGLDLINHPIVLNNDGTFKYWLDRYKYADRFPENPESYYLEQCQHHVSHLDKILQSRSFLCAEKMTALDIALFPFIRQFAFVNKSTFDALPCRALQRWLTHLLEHPLFAAVMTKFPAWQTGDPVTVFPDQSDVSIE